MPIRKGLALTATAAAAEMVLIHLGRTYGSTKEERLARLPGDDIIPAAIKQRAERLRPGPGADAVLVTGQLAGSCTGQRTFGPDVFSVPNADSM
jgi:hypothetical protein